jgi:methylenetetrahydrofolate reductase (NADPH)
VATNNAVFPKDFALSLEANAALTQKLMDLASRYQQHVYLMPIKVPVNAYLDAVVACSASLRV